MNTTIQYRGVELDIEFDYQPEEPMVRYYPDGSGYPGCAEECTINEIEINGVDVTELLEDQVDDISDKVLESLRD